VKLPKPRNVLLGFLIGALVVVGALVIAQDQETLRVRTSLAATDGRFPEYLARLLGTPLTMGDAYVVHTDGPATFAAMLGAMERAAHRISFETYVYTPGEVADRFTAAFEAAAKRGVQVRIVLDSVGAQDMDAGHIERLERAGVKIGWFNKVSGYSIEELNYRTHRKSLIVDGKVAFVGGIGISDQWAMNLPDDPMWRDTQVELRGSAAVNVEASFNENWIESGGEVEPDLLPHVDGPAGPAQSIVVWASPEGGANRMKLLYLLAIASARKTLDIQSPYVVLDESTLWSLTEARQRGVRVRILMEGDITDALPVKFAGRANYEELLEHGIELYEYQPAMMHAKVIVIDGVLSVVGSANFDNRSLELNDELNVAVFDPAFASRLLVDFDRDVKQSKRIALDEWRSRPLHIRAREKGWSYFGEVF
jgi:cardiolipin synthase